MDQSNISENMIKFKNKSKPKAKESMAKKQNYFISVNALYEAREWTPKAFRSEIFPIKTTNVVGRPHMIALHPSELATRLEILSLKQMLQILPITLAQIKEGNTSKKLNKCKLCKLYAFCIKQEKFLKKYIPM